MTSSPALRLQAKALSPLTRQKLPRRLFFAMMLVFFTGLSFSLQTTCGAWAAHKVISGDEPNARFPVSLRFSENKAKVHLFIPLFEEDGALGFFMVRTKERFPQSELEFRMPMSGWANFQNTNENPRVLARLLESPDYRKHHEKMQRFEKILPLKVETRDGLRGLYLEMWKEEARRTYIVYDFLPMGGGGVRDGGLWLTYDIPSFLDVLSKSPDLNQRDLSAIPEVERFQVKDVKVTDEKDGWKHFRITIEHPGKSPPNLDKLGLKFRIWERTPSGSLSQVPEQLLYFWEQTPTEWKNGTEDIVLMWSPTRSPEGNTYHGFTAELFHDNIPIRNWSTSPELLQHPLAFEPMDTREKGCPSAERAVMAYAYNTCLQTPPLTANLPRKVALRTHQDAVRLLDGVREKYQLERPDDMDYIRRKIARSLSLLEQEPSAAAPGE